MATSRFLNNYYQILGVESTATVDKIERAIIKKRAPYHPDKKCEPIKLANMLWDNLNRVEKLLTDETTRGEYDAKLKTANMISINLCLYVLEKEISVSSSAPVDELDDIPAPVIEIPLEKQVLLDSRWVEFFTHRFMGLSPLDPIKLREEFMSDEWQSLFSKNNATLLEKFHLFIFMKVIDGLEDKMKLTFSSDSMNNLKWRLLNDAVKDFMSDNPEWQQDIILNNQNNHANVNMFASHQIKFILDLFHGEESYESALNEIDKSFLTPLTKKRDEIHADALKLEAEGKHESAAYVESVNAVKQLDIVINTDIPERIFTSFSSLVKINKLQALSSAGVVLNDFLLQAAEIRPVTPDSFKREKAYTPYALKNEILEELKTQTRKKEINGYRNVIVGYLKYVIGAVFAVAVIPLLSSRFRHYFFCTDRERIILNGRDKFEKACEPMPDKGHTFRRQHQS